MESVCSYLVDRCGSAATVVAVAMGHRMRTRFDSDPTRCLTTSEIRPKWSKH
jgi:hypothetical protein